MGEPTRSGAEVKREEAAFKDVEERQRVELARLDERDRALRAERDRLAAERDAVASTLEPEHLELFTRVARLRGVAVAEARDSMCQLCHVKVRPQLFVELRRNDSIQQCPACSRVLYYVPTAPVLTP